MLHLDEEVFVYDCNIARMHGFQGETGTGVLVAPTGDSLIDQLTVQIRLGERQSPTVLDVLQRISKAALWLAWYEVQQSKSKAAIFMLRFTDKTPHVPVYSMERLPDRSAKRGPSERLRVEGRSQQQY